MSVEINVPTFLQHLTGDVKLVNADGETVGECLGDLTEQFPQLKARLYNKNGKLRRGLSIFINGESAYPEELAKPVNDGDKIHIVYVMVGG